MATSKVAQDSGRLVKVSLQDVPIDERRKASAALRGILWKQELDPRALGGPPPHEAKIAALGASVELERAALYPKGKHRISEDALLAWLAKKKAKR